MSPREIQPFTCLPRFRVLSKLRLNPQDAIRSDYKWLTVQRFQVFVCAYIIHLKTKGTVIGIVICHWCYLLYELHSHSVSYNLNFYLKILNYRVIGKRQNDDLGSQESSSKRKKELPVSDSHTFHILYSPWWLPKSTRCPLKSEGLEHTLMYLDPITAK